MQREALNDSKGKGSCGDEDAELKGAESEMKVAQSSLTLCDPHVLYSPWNSPGKNTGIGSLSFLQGNFPTQGSNPGLPHCRRVLYQLSQRGRPRILEWVAYPFSSGFSQPRNRTGVSCTASEFFTNWSIREALIPLHSKGNHEQNEKTSYGPGGKYLQMMWPARA